MGKQVFTNAYVSVAGVVLSDHVSDLTLEWDNDAVDVTAMGDGGHNWLVGLYNCKLNVTFWQDFAASNVAATLETAITGGTPVAFKLAPNGTAFSATNPTYSGVFVPTTYQPMSGKVGDGLSTNIAGNVAGTITRGTS